MADVSKSYVICSPGSGSGDTTLNLNAKVANLGNRLNQTDNFTITAPGVTPNKAFAAILQPRPSSSRGTTVPRLRSPKQAAQ